MINFLLALVTGILSGMGIGGGSLLIIVLTAFMGYAQKDAQGINLIYFLPCAALSLVFHIKNGLVDKKTALIVAASGTVGAVVFALIAMNMHNGILRKCFAVLVFVSGIYQLLRREK